MKYKLMKFKGTKGRTIRATVRVKLTKVVTSESLEPTGFLTVSSPPGFRLSEKEHKTFLEWKRKIQSREDKEAKYP